MLRRENYCEAVRRETVRFAFATMTLSVKTLVERASLRTEAISREIILIFISVKIDVLKFWLLRKFLSPILSIEKIVEL